MKLVIVESPYAASTKRQIELNVQYARAAMRDCLKRGEAPYASHLLYTQEGVLEDSCHEERMLGIEAGLRWGKHASATIVYFDLGISRGMQMGIDRAVDEKRDVVFRSFNNLVDGLAETIEHRGRSRISMPIPYTPPDMEDEQAKRVQDLLQRCLFR